MNKTLTTTSKITACKATATAADARHSVDTETGRDAPAELSDLRIKKIFTDIALDYERFNKYSSFGRYRSWLRSLIDRSPITSKSLMLDVAAGTGDVSFMACKRKPPAHIILSDITPAMLEVAQRRLEAGEDHGVAIQLALVDGQDMPFEDESFDILTMSYGIRNMPKREQALSEMYRVLKPGGALCILEFSTPPNALMRLAYRLYLRWGIPAWGKLITDDASGFVYLANSIRAFPDQKGFSQMLSDAGFGCVHYYNLCFGVAAIHIAYKNDAEDRRIP